MSYELTRLLEAIDDYAEQKKRVRAMPEGDEQGMRRVLNDTADAWQRLMDTRQGFSKDSVG